MPKHDKPASTNDDQVIEFDPRADEAMRNIIKHGDHRINDGLLTLLAQTSKAHNQLIKSSLVTHSRFFVRERATSDLLRQLLSHAALGEWQKAEAIWTKHPLLLSCYGTIYHPNRSLDDVVIDVYQNPGRYNYVNVTPFQIACMNDEWNEVATMAKKMTEEEVQRQLDQIFPNGYNKKHAPWSLEEAINLLNAVFDEIVKDPLIHTDDFTKMSDTTQKALHTFYDYVKPKPEHRTGQVFDLDLYLEAIKLYNTRWMHFESTQKESFWCIRVEEWLAAALSTAHLRPHSQGITNYSLERERIGCVLADDSSYFAFRRQSNSVPGHHFFISYAGVADIENSREGRRPEEIGRRLSEIDFDSCPPNRFVLLQSIGEEITRSKIAFLKPYLVSDVPQCIPCTIS